MQRIIVWTQNPFKASLLRLTIGAILGSLGYAIASLWTFLYIPFLIPFLGLEATGALLNAVSTYVGTIFGVIGTYSGVVHGINLITEIIKDEVAKSQQLIVMPSAITNKNPPTAPFKRARIASGFSEKSIFTTEKNASIDSASPLCPKSPAIF